MRTNESIENFYQSDYYRDMYREYMDEIESLCREAIKEKSEELTGDELREAVSDYLSETIDGHCWVIYTAKARLIPLISDVDDAQELEDMGVTEPISPEQRAYACMIADCRDWLSRNDDAFGDSMSEEE